MKVAKILAMAALLFAGAAQAQGYVQFEYYDEHNRETGADNMKLAVVPGIKTANGWDYSLQFAASQTEIGSGAITEGVEARVRKLLTEVNGIKLLAGVRVGEKITSSEHFSHYAFDTMAKFPIAGALGGEVGYRYRNAFESGHSYETNRGHAALAYALTKQDTVGVRWSRSYGDEEKDAWRLTYNRSF